jgi:DNA-binding response OmpR family regulator
MQSSKAVLLVSYQSELFAPHAEALTAVGYEVSHASTLSAALGAVGPGSFDLLVLAPNIPAGDRRRIEAEAKRRHRNLRIVLFYQGERERDVFANAIMDMNGPAGDLVDTAQTLLSDARAAS